jgi:hypothetical protein
MIYNGMPFALALSGYKCAVASRVALTLDFSVITAGCPLPRGCLESRLCRYFPGGDGGMAAPGFASCPVQCAL